MHKHALPDYCIHVCSLVTQLGQSVFKPEAHLGDSKCGIKINIVVVFGRGRGSGAWRGGEIVYARDRQAWAEICALVVWCCAVRGLSCVARGACCGAVSYCDRACLERGEDTVVVHTAVAHTWIAYLDRILEGHIWNAYLENGRRN